MTPGQKKNMSGIIYYTVAVIVVASIFYSCRKDDEECVPPVEHVLFIYMGGDNNLSTEVYQKVAAIQKGWDGNPARKIVIYNDPSDDTPCLIEIAREKGQNIQKVICRYDEENSASSEVLAKRIRDVKSLYSAPSYGMLIFSHASGWLPKGALIHPRSIIIDGEDEMELSNLTTAIPNKTFDYIVMETCFSAGIEVAYELRDKTKYILVSAAEVVSPGFTDIYTEAVNDLLSLDIESFGKKVHNSIKQKQGDWRSSTLSLIKTSELANLASFVKENCDFEIKVQLNDIQKFDRYKYRLFFDFRDYYSHLLKTENQKQELERLINNCVVWKAATEYFMPNSNGFAIKEHSGMTTYIMQDNYPVINTAYLHTKWGKVVKPLE